MRPSRSNPIRPNAADPLSLPSATTSEDLGVRFLHLGTEWIQGAMRISKPDAIELEYVQQMMMWMLFNSHPRHIVQLGLGAGALTKFCYRHFSDSRVTAVELNPAIIRICESMFNLPPVDQRLHILQLNALDFVGALDNKGAVDIFQVDLYDEKARGPVLDTPEFYQACADCLTPDGMLTVNLFGSEESRGRNLDAMQSVFDAVAWLPEVHDGNVVAIAFKRAPEVDFSALYARASAIKGKLNLPAKSWVDGLKIWMAEEGGTA